MIKKAKKQLVLLFIKNDTRKFGCTTHYMTLSYDKVWNCTKRELLNRYFSIFLTIYASQKRTLFLQGAFRQLLLILYLLSYFTILYYTILYYTILYYTILHYTILYYTTLYYTILYYTILYHTIPYYIMLYYTILFLRQKVMPCLLEVNVGK